MTASGDDGEFDVYEAPLATLRTIVSFDRILLPKDNLAALYELENGEEEAQEQDANEEPDGAQSIDELGLDPSLFPPGVLGPDGTIIQFPGGDTFTPAQGRGVPSNPRRPINPLDRQGQDRVTPRIVAPNTSTSSTGNNRSGGNNQ